MGAGTRRGSNQSNAKEWTRGTISADDRDCRRKLYMFLSDLSTSYYADKIIEWINSQVEIERF